MIPSIPQVARWLVTHQDHSNGGRITPLQALLRIASALLLFAVFTWVLGFAMGIYTGVPE